MKKATSECATGFRNVCSRKFDDPPDDRRREHFLMRFAIAVSDRNPETMTFVRLDTKPFVVALELVQNGVPCFT